MIRLLRSESRTRSSSSPTWPLFARAWAWFLAAITFRRARLRNRRATIESRVSPSRRLGELQQDFGPRYWARSRSGTVDERRSVVVSPCSAVVGAMGRLRDGEWRPQAGARADYTRLFREIRVDPQCRDGLFLVLRLPVDQEQRVHAPDGGRVWTRNEPAHVVVEVESGESTETIRLMLAATVGAAGFELAEGVAAPGRVLARGEALGTLSNGRVVVVLLSGDFEFVPVVKTGVVVGMGTPLVRRVSRPEASRLRPLPQVAPILSGLLPRRPAV